MERTIGLNQRVNVPAIRGNGSWALWVARAMRFKSACRAGFSYLRSNHFLLDKYGPETVRACMAELDRRSEQQMRAYIAEIPDGIYT